MSSTITHSITLHPGQHYLLRYFSDPSGQPACRVVTLIRSTVCPAMVIVEDAQQRRFPCDRLYLIELDAAQPPDKTTVVVTTPLLFPYFPFVKFEHPAHS